MVVRPPTPPLPIASTFFFPLLFISPFLFLISSSVFSKGERDKQESEDAAAVAPRRLRGRKESELVSNQRGRESRGVTEEEEEEEEIEAAAAAMCWLNRGGNLAYYCCVIFQCCTFGVKV